MKNGRFTTAQKVGILFEILIQGVLFLPWIPLQGDNYSTQKYLIHVFLYGSPVKEMAEMTEGILGAERAGMAAYSITFLAGFLILLQVLELFQMYLLVRGKDITWPNLFNLAISNIITYFIGIGLANSLGIWFFTYPLIVMIVVLMKLCLVKGLEEYHEASKAYKEMRKRDAKERKERKIRLAFPGKYSRIFYRCMWKNFWHSRRQYGLFVMAGALVSCLLFVSIGVRKMFLEGYGEDYGLIGLGISSMLQNFIVIVVVLSVFLVTLILVTYLKNRISDYGLLQLLGIRQNVLGRIYAAELIACYIFAVAFGVIAGNVVLLLLRPVIQMILPEGVALLRPDGSVYAGAFLITLAIYLLSLFVSHDIYVEMNAVNTKDARQKKEKMPGKFRYLTLTAGIILCVYSVYRLTERRTAESMFMVCLLFIGLYLALPTLWAFVVQNTKKYSQKYLKRMLEEHMLLHKFKTSSRYFMVLSMIHISALFYFTVQVVTNQTAEEAESVIPYDYMCLANETDDALFEQLEVTCGADIIRFPMVRATTVDNTEGLEDFRKVMEPQGQNIGISEATYKQLKEMAGQDPEKLDLHADGSDIYVVYQQDESAAAVPIDWYFDRKTPYVHIGQPVLYYGWPERKVIFEPRQIAGEEVTILTGAYRQGRYENLIVFSDEYFAQASQNCKEGPTQLILMNVPAEMQEKAERLLSTFRENHKEDEAFDYLVQSCYVKKEIVTQRKMERTMGSLINLFVIFMLGMISIFMLHIKSQAEIEEMERRYQFMKCFGMRKKERVSLQKKEIARFVYIPLLIAGVVSPVLTGMTLYVRGFGRENILLYIEYAAGIWMIYIAGQFLNMKLIQHNIEKRIEERNERSY